LILCYRTAEDAHGEMILEYFFRTFTLWIWIHSCHYIWFCSD
jgi:hypothetical protein